MIHTPFQTSIALPCGLVISEKTTFILLDSMTSPTPRRLDPANPYERTAFAGRPDKSADECVLRGPCAGTFVV